MSSVEALRGGAAVSVQVSGRAEAQTDAQLLRAGSLDVELALLVDEGGGDAGIVDRVDDVADGGVRVDRQLDFRELAIRDRRRIAAADLDHHRRGGIGAGGAGQVEAEVTGRAGSRGGGGVGDIGRADFAGGAKALVERDVLQALAGHGRFGGGSQLRAGAGDGQEITGAWIPDAGTAARGRRPNRILSRGQPRSVRRAGDAPDD